MRISTDFKNNSFLNFTTKKNVVKALVILLVGLIISVVVTIFTYRDVQSLAKLEYTTVCNEIKNKITARLNSHAQLLRTGAAYHLVLDLS